MRSFWQDARDDLRNAAAQAAQRPDCFAPREFDDLEQLAQMPTSPPPGPTGGEVTVEPAAVDTSPPARPEAQARMCSALADLDEQFLDDLAAGDMAGDPAGRRMTTSLMAAAGYDEALALREDDDSLQEAADGLRDAISRVQGEVARQRVDDLRTYC